MHKREVRIYSDRVETDGFWAPSKVCHENIESIEIPGAMPTQVFINLRDARGNPGMINFGPFMAGWLRVVAALASVVPDSVEKTGSEEMWDKVRDMQGEIRVNQ